jgi:hypothetical protein
MAMSKLACRRMVGKTMMDRNISLRQDIADWYSTPKTNGINMSASELIAANESAEYNA